MFISRRPCVQRCRGVQVTRLHSVNSGYKGGQRSVTQITIVSQHVIINHSRRSFLCVGQWGTRSQRAARDCPAPCQTFRHVAGLQSLRPPRQRPPPPRNAQNHGPSREPKKPYFLATSFKPCTIWPLSEHVFQHLASLTRHC